MNDQPTAMQRRKLLQSAAATAIGATLLQVAGAKPVDTGRNDAATDNGIGKPGDFDFLAGSWIIAHRRLKAPADKTWDEFGGEATCWTILAGVGSIEELRIPARQFSGMGLRLLNVEKKVWADHWVNARSGVLASPGAPGVFKNGVGTFIADDVDGNQPIKVRGVWDKITKNGCRWHQAISRDDGKTWQENWFMDWTRV